MRLKRFVFPLVIYLLLNLLILTCKKDSPSGPDSGKQNGVSEAVITSAGGKVEDADGASISVPAGALSSPMTIGVRTLHPDALPDAMQSAIVENIIECLPHGATFQKPVTIILPVTSGMTYQAGDTVNLFIFNTDSSYWERTDIPGYVTADGKHIEAPVVHFSNYGTNTPRGYDNSGDKDFDNIEDGLDLSLTVPGWVSAYLERIGGLGAKKWMRDCCMKLANATFDFQYTSTSFSKNITEVRGDPASCDKMERHVELEGMIEDGYHMKVDIRLCWTICNPDISLNAYPTIFFVPDGVGRTSDLTARVQCGDGPKSGSMPVQFSIEGGPGTIDPSTVDADARGTAHSTYTVTGAGTANITAGVRTCASDRPQTGSAGAVIRVDSLKPYYIAAHVRIEHGGPDMPWNFTDSLIMILEISAQENALTITGGDASQYARCIAADGECSIRNLTAPDFVPTGRVTKVGDSVDVEFNPNLAVINFDYYCDFGDGDIFSEPFPGYSYMVSSIIAMHVKGRVGMIDGSTTTGSGSEDFGEDLPVKYSFSIIYAAQIQN